jgi:hypothetical protein
MAPRPPSIVAKTRSRRVHRLSLTPAELPGAVSLVKLMGRPAELLADGSRGFDDPAATAVPAVPARRRGDRVQSDRFRCHGVFLLYVFG